MRALSSVGRATPLHGEGRGFKSLTAHSMKNDSHVALHAVISGRVQLVMFRDFVQRKATGLHLMGEVRNLKDGTVTVVAEGERAGLEKLVEHLKRGPLLSRVDGVAVEWKEPKGVFKSFSINYQ